MKQYIIATKEYETVKNSRDLTIYFNTKEEAETFGCYYFDEQIPESPTNFKIIEIN